MIYLDHAATTPLPPAVAEAMYDVLANDFANPSAQYPAGVAMKKRVEGWRAAIADAIPCQPRQLHFTSCGTESAARRATTGPSRPPCGRTAGWAATSSPPPWSTAPFWSR